MRWKKETLAIQKSHKEAEQRTGLWAQQVAVLEYFVGKDVELLTKGRIVVIVLTDCLLVVKGCGDRLDGAGRDSEYCVELSPGWRLVSRWRYVSLGTLDFLLCSGGVEARWNCPKHKELGCPATFVTRIGVTEEGGNGERGVCQSSSHCQGCSLYRRYKTFCFERLNHVDYWIDSFGFSTWRQMKLG